MLRFYCIECPEEGPNATRKPRKRITRLPPFKFILSDDNGRKLMILLSYDVPSYMDYIEKGERFDLPFVDYLETAGITYVDFLEKKAAAFKDFNLPLEQFLERFYIERAGAQVFGHYRPYGNFWFAFELRRHLVDWLDPKPPAYV